MAHQIKRKGYRMCAGPLDWVVSQDVQAVVDILKSTFRDYMLYENLEILGVLLLHHKNHRFFLPCHQFVLLFY